MTDTRLALRDVRGPLNDLNEKLSGEDGQMWLTGFKKFLRKENPWEEQLVTTYPTSFLPGLTWKERIDACKFDYVDPDIWQNIDSFVDVGEEDSSSQDIELDRFGKVMMSDGLESFQAENGKEMISPARFLHLCEQHPELQRKHHIICTKQICVDRDGYVCVLYAIGSADERSLCLDYRDRGWDGYCRFPFTRNVSSELGTGNFRT